jgi:putative flippase GtrA
LYLLAFLVSYAVNLGVVLLLIHGLGANSYLAQAAGIPFYALFFFITCQHFVFKESRDGSTALTP